MIVRWMLLGLSVFAALSALVVLLSLPGQSTQLFTVLFAVNALFAVYHVVVLVRSHD